jgi:hypothetical protein
VAISSGVFPLLVFVAAGFAVLSMAEPCAKTVEANAIKSSGINAIRTNFISHLPDLSSRHARPLEQESSHAAF